MQCVSGYKVQRGESMSNNGWAELDINMRALHLHSQKVKVKV